VCPCCYGYRPNKVKVTTARILQQGGMPPAIWVWCTLLVAASRCSLTWEHPLGPTGSPQHLLLGGNHPWLLQEPVVHLCTPAPWWPHTATWAWCTLLVAPSMCSTTWEHPLVPTGSPQHLLLGGNHPWLLQEPVVHLCTPAPLVATHCHLGLVQHNLGAHFGPYWVPPTPAAWG